LEGSYQSHQVPLPKAATDENHLKLLNEWLGSYRPSELFSKKGQVLDEVLDIVPNDVNLRMGQRKETYAAYSPPKVPDWRAFGVDKSEEVSCMQAVGNLLDKSLVENPRQLRLFSPDELVSNKLDAVFNNTHRSFQWGKDASNGGRVIEMLSEHTLQGFLQGYTLTGGVGVFPSYESFLGIVSTMVIQFGKFSKLMAETTWRKPVSSVNYIETSTWTRQEHNGFSHQNPSFIGTVLNIKAAAARVYLPPDANCFLSTVAHCLESKGYVNLMVGSKQPSPIYLTTEEADAHCKAGASIFKFASTEEGVNPDVVLVGIGVELTFEVVKAAAWLRKYIPELRVRVVNVTDLMILVYEGEHPHSLTQAGFSELFTENKPVCINYHGYPTEIKGLLFGRPNMDRVTIKGYSEEGTTTTPFDMMLLNGVSRFELAKQTLESSLVGKPESREKVTALIDQLRKEKEDARHYIYTNGKGKRSGSKEDETLFRYADAFVDPDGFYDTSDIAVNPAT
jgi:xylulose-5-phosphate/fructose-6-phosphate phosphoketolase